MISNTLTPSKLVISDAIATFTMTATAAAAAIAFGGVVVSTSVAIGAAALTTVVSTIANRVFDKFYVKNNQRASLGANTLIAISFGAASAAAAFALGAATSTVAAVGVALAVTVLASRVLFKGLSAENLLMLEAARRNEVKKQKLTADLKAAIEAVNKEALVLDNGKTRSDAAEAQTAREKANEMPESTDAEKAAKTNALAAAEGKYTYFSALHAYQGATQELAAAQKALADNANADQKQALEGTVDAAKAKADAALHAIPTIALLRSQLQEISSCDTVDAVWKKICPTKQK